MAERVDNSDDPIEEATEFLIANLRRIISLVIGIATLVPVILIIFNAFDLTFKEQILASVFGILVFFFIAESIAVYGLYAKLKQKSRSEWDIEFYGLAFSTLLFDDDRIMDRTHHFTYQLRELDMSGKEVEYKNVARGYNATTEKSDSLTMKLTADSPISSEDLALKVKQNVAFDSGGEEWVDLNPTRVSKVQSYDIILKIPFQEPLEQNERFEIELECKLGTISQDSKEQYAFMPLHRLTRGVDNFVAKHILDERVKEGEAMKIIPRTDMSHERSVGKVDIDNFDISEIPMNVNPIDSKKEFTLHDGDNAAALYLFKFRRE